MTNGEVPAKETTPPGEKVTAQRVAELEQIVGKQREDLDAVTWLLAALLHQVHQAQAKAVMDKIGPELQRAIQAKLSGAQPTPELQALMAKLAGG